jgi:hypothetical protein
VTAKKGGGTPIRVSVFHPRLVQTWRQFRIMIDPDMKNVIETSRLSLKGLTFQEENYRGTSVTLNLQGMTKEQGLMTLSIEMRFLTQAQADHLMSLLRMKEKFRMTLEVGE